MKKIIVLAVILNLFQNLNLKAQAPGATCFTATPIMLGSCTGTQTITDFTAEGTSPAVSCASGTFRREGWYSVTIPAGPSVNVSVVGTSITTNSDLIIQIISGTCAAETQAACANTIVGSSAQSETATIITGVLAVATTYYIRVMNYGSAVNMAMDNLCVLGFDDCPGLAIYDNTTCINTFGTLNGATPSAIASCGIGIPNNDVWYNFTASSVSGFVEVEVTSTADIVIQFFDGLSCSGGFSMGCTNNVTGGGTETGIYGMLLPGTSYSIRIYDITGADTSSFSICVHDVITQGITGNTFSDNNSNCIYDAGDAALNNIPVKLYDSVGNILGLTYTTYTGVYNFQRPPGTYRVAIDTATMPYAATCPQPGIDSTLFVTSGTITTVNFPMTCDSSGFDVGVTGAGPHNFVFPGLVNSFHSFIGNIGYLSGFPCAPSVSGTVQINFSGPVTYLAPWGPALTPTTVIGNMLTYNIADFNTLGFYSFWVNLQTDTSATIGDVICATITVTPSISGDVNLSNNSFHYCYIVGNSYDPNYKETYPTQVLPGYNDYFIYTVQFQNTGTSPAINIKVTDTLSSLLDLSTFELLGTSHSTTNVLSLNGNVLTMNYYYINLPDSTTNEPLSHGFFQYRIKPLSGLPDGTHIYNTANIYFDYNSPIRTNTSVNEYSFITGVNEFTNQQSSIEIYPNPATSVFTIESTKHQVQTIKMYDVLGQCVYQSAPKNNQSTININQYSKGIYFVEIKTEKGIVNRKIVVQ